MSTETVDPRFVDIDRWPTRLAVEAMLEGQLAAGASLRTEVPALAVAAEAAAARLTRRGRLVYAGAGTSGRIAVQDGVELGPTFSWPASRLVFLLAGGLDALSESAEGAEDDAGAAAAQVEAAGVTEADVVVGVAASGRTPFTVEVVRQARERGALTLGVANNPDTPLLAVAEHALLADTGSELIAGSTRMKAGTAQKALLNIFSTATMLRCGLVYRGLMVNMRVSNEKLNLRARGMVEQLADVDATEAQDALTRADDHIKTAVLLASGAPLGQAVELLAQHDQNLRRALEAYRKGAA